MQASGNSLPEGLLDRDTDQHLRKHCGHCDANLSYSAFLAHQARFYDRETETWITESARPDVAEHNVQMMIDEPECNEEDYFDIGHHCIEETISSSLSLNSDSSSESSTELNEVSS